MTFTLANSGVTIVNNSEVAPHLQALIDADSKATAGAGACDLYTVLEAVDQVESLLGQEIIVEI